LGQISGSVFALNIKEFWAKFLECWAKSLEALNIKEFWAKFLEALNIKECWAKFLEALNIKECWAKFLDLSLLLILRNFGPISGSVFALNIPQARNVGPNSES
jgi:hypothetical protein